MLSGLVWSMLNWFYEKFLQERDASVIIIREKCVNFCVDALL
jgi:hypothetical protein